MASNIEENPGCANIFALLFGGRRSKKKKKSINDKPPYHLRDDFLSPAEFSFFKVLTSLAGQRLTVLTKVNLGDLFFVSRSFNSMIYKNKIDRKHLDFLICDSITMKPLLGIELDDSSHKRINRMERDWFVNQVFESAGLPLLHVTAQREYNTKELAARIVPLIRDKVTPLPQNDQSSPATTVNPTPVKTEPSPPTSPAPMCPKCGIPMVLRTVTQGEHKGKQFYGCSNFPHCRAMKPARS
jgi:hypothetical protein